MHPLWGRTRTYSIPNKDSVTNGPKQFKLDIATRYYPVQVRITPIHFLPRVRLHGHANINQIPQVTLQVSPNMPHNLYNTPPIQNQFAPPAYFPITFPPPPIAPSNVSAVPSAPALDLSAAITLMTNAVNQGNHGCLAENNIPVC